MWKSAICAGIVVLAFPVASMAAPRPGRDAAPSLATTLTVTAPAGRDFGPRVILATRALPEYPPAARRGRIEGLVHLIGLIDEEGRVKDLQCVEGDGDPTGFQRAAMAAVGTWSYQPALAPDGRPVTVSVLFEVRFLPQ